MGHSSTNMNTEVSAEIGAVAPLSDTLRMSGGSGMAPSSRDRISVDLRGLKAALFERARALGVSPSGLVRTILTETLGQSEPTTIEQSRPSHVSGNGGRVRLYLRMSRDQVMATFEGARRAGLNPGDYVGDLVAGVPVLMGAGRRTAHLAALIASSAELSTFSRNLHHLTSLLREGAFRAAAEYRPMLETLGADVRDHLMLASGVLADLRPRSRSADAATHPTT
jgi:hypothetical protein